MENTAITWDGEELGATFQTGPIPDDLKEQAAEYREKLIETAVELDDDAMMAYLEARPSALSSLRCG